MSRVLPMPPKKKAVVDVTEWLPIAALETDPQVQRPYNEGWAKKIAQDLDPEYIGVVHVSERPDGRYVILDGQHRVGAFRELGWFDQKIECKVHRGLTLAEEAAFFVHLNNFRRPTYFDAFMKRIVAKDEDAVTIDEIVRGVGLKIEAQQRDGHIQCVRTLERIYRGEKFNVKSRQPIILRKTLLIAKGAWGLTSDAMNGDLLHGIGLLLLRYGLKVDDKHLHSKLAPVDGGPLGILGRARTLKSFRGGTVANCVGEVVTDLYNKGKREHKLPDWRGESTNA